MPVTIGKKYISSGYNGAITAVNGKTGAVALTPSDIGLDNVTNDAQIKRSEMGIANGIALLDINGKLVNTQLPESIIGAVNYRGIWNANTNTPEIPISSINNKGYYYVVSVLGATEINGISSWAVGDWIISDGSTWSKITTTQSVSSVAGKTGAVTLVKGDVGLGNVQNVNQTNADNLTSGTVNTARLPVMGASGVNHSAGIVPDTGDVEGITKFLCEDGVWKTPVGGIAGSNGQIQFNDNGSSGADSNLTWNNISKVLTVDGTISTADGTNGYVTMNPDSSPNRTGFFEWKKGDGTRLGFMGDGETDVTLAVENGANFVVNGYTKLGNDAPAIKFKEISGNTPSTVSTMGSYTHGLTKSKILGVQVVVENSGGTLILPHNGHPYESGDYYYAQVTDTVLAIHTAANSTSILNKPFRAIITYKE